MQLKWHHSLLFAFSFNLEIKNWRRLQTNWFSVLIKNPTYVKGPDTRLQILLNLCKFLDLTQKSYSVKPVAVVTHDML